MTRIGGYLYKRKVEPRPFSLNVHPGGHQQAQHATNTAKASWTLQHDTKHMMSTSSIIDTSGYMMLQSGKGRRQAVNRLLTSSAHLHCNTRQ
jgi:hypothetical protein